MSNSGLKGKKAVVTAAAQGIGRATAEAFAKAGAEVWATDVNSAKLEELRDTPGISIRTLDVRDSAAITRFGKEAGPIDVLFNCAGFVHHGTILESTEADLDLAFDLNVKSMYRTITAFLPGMLEKGEARSSTCPRCAAALRACRTVSCTA